MCVSCNTLVIPQKQYDPAKHHIVTRPSSSLSPSSSSAQNQQTENPQQQQPPRQMSFKDPLPPVVISPEKVQQSNDNKLDHQGQELFENGKEEMYRKAKDLSNPNSLPNVRFKVSCSILTLFVFVYNIYM